VTGCVPARTQVPAGGYGEALHAPAGGLSHALELHRPRLPARAAPGDERGSGPSDAGDGESERMTGLRRRRVDGAALLLAAIGGTQLALLILALARVLDPGWLVFDTIGTLSGLGMAGIAGLVRARQTGAHPATGALSLLAAVAGLVSAGVWASLLGGGFYTDDHLRILLHAGADVLFALWTVVAAIALRSSRIPGLRAATALLVIWAAAEVRSLPLFFTPAAGAGAVGMTAALLAALAVCFGWIVLAIWEIWLGVRLPATQ
jgi:hypothetical protein